MRAALRHFSSTSSKPSTSVYIWRAMPQAATKASQEITTGIQIRKGRPSKIQALDDKGIEKIYFGIRHSAVLSHEGQLYTFGNGNYGVLGHGSEQNINFKEPRLVSFFEEAALPVEQVALGEYHSMALTRDGRVFTWGFGGSTGLWAYFSQNIGALGHGDQATHYTPKPVQWFQERNIKITQIGAGVNLSVALDTEGRVYSWGKGNYGLLGDGHNTHALTPILNEALDLYAQEDEQNRIVKIGAADEFTAAITAKGELFVWGKNDRGQLGTDSGVGIDMIESESLPTNMKFVEGQIPRIVDMECGQNAMLLLDDQGTIYRTGLKLDYVPRNTRRQFGELYESKIRLMGCGTKHYVFVNERGQIITWGNILNGLEKLDTGHQIGNVQSAFSAEGKRVKQLAVKYGTFGALLEDI